MGEIYGAEEARGSEDKLPDEGDHALALHGADIHDAGECCVQHDRPIRNSDLWISLFCELFQPDIMNLILAFDIITDGPCRVNRKRRKTIFFY